MKWATHMVGKWIFTTLNDTLIYVQFISVENFYLDKNDLWEIICDLHLINERLSLRKPTF